MPIKCLQNTADGTPCRPLTIVQYWAGCPEVANSKWAWYLDVVRRSCARGWRTFMVWSRMPEDERLWKPFVDAGCSIVIQPRTRRNFDWGCVWRTWALARRTRCDVFHCYNSHTSPLIGAALARVPVRVWSVLGMSSAYEQGLPPRGLHALGMSSRVSGLLASKVLCIAKAVGEELCVNGVARRKIQTLLQCVDPDGLQRSSPGDVRSGLGIEEHALVVTTVGHAVPVKGWDILLHAFAHAAGDRSDAVLLLVGGTESGDERSTAAALKDLSRRLVSKAKVIFAGRRSDVSALLAASDVFVLPSRSEGTPAALIEAMHAGLPCVAASVGGVPELIQHRQNGLLFERENVEQLAEALREIIRDDTLRTRISLNASAAIEEMKKTPIAQTLLGLYQEEFARQKG